MVMYFEHYARQYFMCVCVSSKHRVGQYWSHSDTDLVNETIYKTFIAKGPALSLSDRQTNKTKLLYNIGLTLFFLSVLHLVHYNHELLANHSRFSGMFSFSKCCCVPLCCHRESRREVEKWFPHVWILLCSLAVCVCHRELWLIGPIH